MNYIIKGDGLFDDCNDGSQPLNADDFVKPKTIKVSPMKEQPLCVARKKSESGLKRFLLTITGRSHKNKHDITSL